MTRLLRRGAVLAALALLAGICTPAHAAQVHAYGTDPEQTIEVTPLTGSNPWIALIHGGSWAGGSTLDMVRAQKVFTAASFVVFNVEYRKITDYPDNPGVPWAKQRDGILAALDWIHTHAAEYGADPERGAIYGFSAGGHLAASAGLYGAGLSRVKAIVSASGPLQPHRLALVADSDPAVGFAGDKPTPQNRTLARWAAVAMRCPDVAWYGCSTRWSDFKPENHISADDPPIFMFQGTADPVVPPQTPRSFKYWMNRAGLEAQLVECVNWTHTEFCALDSSWRQAKLIAWLTAKTA